MQTTKRATILYDADCGFCRWALDKILAWDRRNALRSVTLQSAEADSLLAGMDEQTKMASWHLVAENGRIYSAGAAAAPLARLLPLGAPLALVAQTFPRTTNRIYRWVARNRNRLGARLGAQVCAVDPSARNVSSPAPQQTSPDSGG